MKNLFLFLFLSAAAFGADAANDVILSQRKADNSGFIQRNVAPTTSGFLTFDTSKLPISPSGLTYVNGNGTTTGQLIHPVGAVGTPSVTFLGRTTNGLYSPAANTVDMAINGAVNARFVTTHLLLGGLTTDGTGVLQFPTATTSAGGITMGTDTWFYRRAAGEFGVDSTQGVTRLRLLQNTGALGVSIYNSAGVLGLYTDTAANLELGYSGTTVARLDSTTNMTVLGTKTLKFGATANATIGVSADTTAGNLVVTPTSTGGILLGAAAQAASYNMVTVGGTGLTTAEDGNGKLRIGRYSAGAAYSYIGLSTNSIGLRVSNASDNADILTINNSSGALSLSGGAGNMTIQSGTGASRTMTLQTTTSGGTGTNAIVINDVQAVTFSGAIITTPQALSGAGAVNVTTTSTFLTSTGVLDALTLANGTSEGQFKTIVHKVDGGSAVLTPTTALGFTTVTFTNVGETLTLQWTSAGWVILSSRGAVVA